MAFQSPSNVTITNSATNRTSATTPGNIPNSLSTNGIPKTISIAASKSFLLNGTLEFNLLDMSADDGDNTPLDQGTRSMRFISAASNLLEHFGSDGLEPSSVPNHHTPMGPVLEPLSGSKRNGGNFKGHNMESKATIIEANSPALEIESMIPPALPTLKRCVNHVPLKVLRSHTDKTFSSSSLPEESRNSLLPSPGPVNPLAKRAVHHENNNPNTHSHLVTTYVTVSAEESSLHDQQTVAPRRCTIPDYSIDEITPNTSPVTPSRTRRQKMEEAVATSEMVVSPKVDTSAVQGNQSNNDQGQRKKKKRSTLQDILLLRRFASRNPEETGSPQEASNKSSLFKRLSLSKRTSSPRHHTAETSPFGSRDQLDQESVSRAAKGKRFILSRIPLLKKVSSLDDPAVNGSESRCRRDGEMPEAAQNPSSERDAADEQHYSNHPLEAFKRRVVKFLYRFID